MLTRGVQREGVHKLAIWVVEKARSLEWWASPASLGGWGRKVSMKKKYRSQEDWMQQIFTTGDLGRAGFWFPNTNPGWCFETNIVKHCQRLLCRLRTWGYREWGCHSNDRYGHDENCQKSYKSIIVIVLASRSPFLNSSNVIHVRVILPLAIGNRNQLACFYKGRRIHLKDMICHIS